MVLVDALDEAPALRRWSTIAFEAIRCSHAANGVPLGW
jgi:hypothetical protein